MNVETINFGQHAKVKIKAAIEFPEDVDPAYVCLSSDIYAIEVSYLDGTVTLTYYKKNYKTGYFETSQEYEFDIDIDIEQELELELELNPRLRQIIKAIVEGKPIKNTYVATVTINNSVQKTIELDITDLTTQFEIRTHNLEIKNIGILRKY